MMACGLNSVGQQLKLEAEVKKLRGHDPSITLPATSCDVTPTRKLPSVKARKRLLTPSQDRISESSKKVFYNYFFLLSINKT